MLLEVHDLRTSFEFPGGAVRAVDGVSFEIPQGGTLALVGESGCGKSLTALSILRLVPRPGRITGGTISFEGREVTGLPEAEIRAIRGNRIGMIFQEPMTSLNPLLTVGDQIGETLRLHRGLSRRVAREHVKELLHRVGIPTPAERARAYPHEMSGGMRQRVMIAMALACEPALLIADEPTTALDVTIQAQILELLRDLQRSSGMAMLFITHDLAVVAQIAQNVAVMYAGRIVERGPVADVLHAPRHPYTQGLLRSTPHLAGTRGPGRRLPVIPGDVPPAWERPAGCAFQTRCECGHEDVRCRSETPALEEHEPGRAVACGRIGRR